jgi:hypothetical protein
MATVQSFCDRAMLIHDGELRYIGDPEEAALRYYRLNFGGDGAERNRGDVPDVNVRLIDVWLSNPAGERVQNIEQGTPIGFNMIVEARRELVHPVFSFHFLNGDGLTVFGFTVTINLPEDQAEIVPAGKRVRLCGLIENPLLPGRYNVSTIISRNRSIGDLALHLLRVLEFVVYGTSPGAGAVGVHTDVEAVIED